LRGDGPPPAGRRRGQLQPLPAPVRCRGLPVHGVPRRPGHYQGDERRGQGTDVVREVRWTLRSDDPDRGLTAPCTARYTEIQSEGFPMQHIVLTEEQWRVLAQAGTPVEVRDPKGNWLGC